MFTVLSNARSSNLYAVAILAAAVIVVLTFAVAPALSVSKPAVVPVTGLSDSTSDYFLRHPEWTWASSNQAAVIPVTGSTDLSDYFLRHPELIPSTGMIIDTAIDTSDYFLRHPELSAPAAVTIDTDDYFLRHPEPQH